MPTYQYACTSCGEQVEAVQRFSDDPLTVCAACGGTLRKVFSPVGIVFKGSGFYRTDSRKATAKSEDAGDKAAKAKDSPGSGEGSSGAKKDSASPGQLGRRQEARCGEGVPARPLRIRYLTGHDGRRRCRPDRRHRRFRVLRVLLARPTRSACRRRTASRATRSWWARWPAAGWRSCPGTAATTGSRRTASRTGRTCGRCARSASGRCSRRARSGR